VRRLAAERRRLVLDDLDALLAGAADGARALDGLTERIAGWLDAAPGLALLVTCRRRLRHPAEHALPLDPLPEEDGVELFVLGVQRHRPTWAPSAAERADLAPLIRALDGIPLAIELAAARWELLGTAGLLARLAQPLSVLSRPRGAADPRHATLRAAIASAWELLGDSDRQALSALAMLSAPFDVAAAEALLGPAALDRLEALRDAALLLVPEPGRTAMLGVVRAFALEQATPEAAAAAEEAHARWLLGQIGDPEVVAPSAALAEDLYAAARRGVDAGDLRVEPLLTALGIAAPGMHLDLLDDAVARFGTAPILRVRGRLHRLHGRSEAAERDFELALARAGSPGLRGSLLRELGVLHHGRREIERARERYEAALAAHREAGDRRAEAITTGNLGALDHDICRYEDAEVQYEAALAGLREVGDRRIEAVFLANGAVLRQEQGDLVGAEAAYRAALALHQAEGDEQMLGITLGNLGQLEHELGNLASAEDHHRRALSSLARVVDPSSTARCQARLAAVLATLGDHAAAGPLLDEAEREAVDPVVRDLVGLFRGFLDLAAGDEDGVRRRLARAGPLLDIDGDARVAARLLRAALPEGCVLLVTADGQSFAPPGGEPQDLSRHASCRRMFAALVDRRLAAPGAPLSLDELFRTGWPGERIAAASVRNRVHVNLARLRSLGLKRVLVRTEEGYHLDPQVPIRTVQATGGGEGSAR
jgi:tetratricopeptide (TPR) repeat protein